MAWLPNIPIPAAFLVSFILLVLCRSALKFGGVKTRVGEWFLCHAFGNAVIVLLIADEVSNVFLEPETALIRPLSAPTIDTNHGAMLGMIHLFHVIFYYKDLKGMDWFHHLVFVPFNQIAFFMPYLAGWEHVKWGPLIPAVNFFACGLPGGIDYLFLGLIKEGWLGKKSVYDRNWWKPKQASLNAWCRAPGIIAMVTLILFEALRNADTVPLSGRIVCYINFVVIGYNGLHYMEAVVASAGKNNESFRGTS